MRGSTFSEKNCTRKNVKVEKRRTFCGSSFWSALFRRYIKCSGAIGDEVRRRSQWCGEETFWHQLRSEFLCQQTMGREGKGTERKDRRRTEALPYAN